MGVLRCAASRERESFCFSIDHALVNSNTNYNIIIIQFFYLYLVCVLVMEGGGGSWLACPKIHVDLIFIYIYM